MNPTSKEWLRAEVDDISERGIKPNVDSISRITRDGDVAVLFHESEGLAIPAPTKSMFAKLRGTVTEPVVRLTRTRARRVFGAVDSPICRWAIDRPRDGRERVLVCAHGSFYLVNFTRARGFWLDEASPQYAGPT